MSYETHGETEGILTESLGLAVIVGAILGCIALLCGGWGVAFWAFLFSGTITYAIVVWLSFADRTAERSRRDQQRSLELQASSRAAAIAHQAASLQHRQLRNRVEAQQILARNLTMSQAHITSPADAFRIRAVGNDLAREVQDIVTNVNAMNAVPLVRKAADRFNERVRDDH